MRRRGRIERSIAWLFTWARFKFSIGRDARARRFALVIVPRFMRVCSDTARLKIEMRKSAIGPIVVPAKRLA